MTCLSLMSLTGHAEPQGVGYAHRKDLPSPVFFAFSNERSE